MKRTVLITGTSKGIGFALAQQFLSNGDIVIGTSSTGDVLNISHSDFQLLKLDLSDNESIDGFCEFLRQRNMAFDIVINNAGIGPDLDTVKPEIDSFRKTLEVNLTGTAFLIEQLCSYMNVGGKIINITSKMGSIELCELTDAVAYRVSKAALNMYTKILANRLKGKQLVAAVHPGWVRTTIAKSNINGRLSPEESAKRIYDFIMSDFKTSIFWNVETQTECKW